jgi:hypothetical protein
MFVSQIFEECAEILGTTDENKVFRKIQQAVATLMESGHWTHSVADVDVCTGWDRCSITLPRNIDVPLAVNIDGSPTYFRNRLFQYHVNKGGMFNSVEWAWDDRGYVATLMDIIQPSQLVAIAELENDVGKTIRVLGNDQDNRTLRSQLANGTGVDGLLVPIHSQSDFAYGTIAPDDATVKTRSVAIMPINLFTSATAHGLSSGQGMSVTAATGTIPVALENGQTYYIGVIDAYKVQLFNDPLNAQALQYPINLQSIVGAGNLTFKDSRESQVVTALELASAPAFTIDTANQITFPTGQSLPSPLNSETIYYANAEDSTHLTVFETSDDAKRNINPVYTTGSTAPLNVDIRKNIDPQTTLTFSVRHYYNDGDQVQAFTASGNLPKPLIENQNYFVNVIDPFSVSLHENKADAIASTPTSLVNPIVIKDSGSGTNSIVKLISATATTGTSSQITAPGLNIQTPSGSGANFQAVVVGSVTEINITAAGGGYTATPNIAFSAPPTPPVGSPITPLTATGYAVRNTVNNTISGIVITNPGLGYSTPPLITIDPPPINPTISITSLTSSATTATCTTLNPHGFTSGNEVTISGATPTGYNGTYIVNVTGSNTFTYTLNASVGYDKSISSLVSGKAVTSITHVTTTATVNSTSHGFTNGQSVIIVGANQSQYNGTFTIVYVNPNQFTYTMASDPGVDATGTIRASASSGTTATATTSTPHGFSNGQSVLISGATPPAYNKQAIISNVTASTFDYSVDGGLLSPATGTINVFSTPATGTMTCALKAGSQAVATANITTSFVSHFTLISGGSGYTEAPQVKITGGNGSGATATATVNNATISVSSLTRSGTIATATTTSPHGYATGQVIQVSGATPSGYNGNVTITAPTINTSVSSITRVGTTATVTTASNHNYITGQRVTIYGCTGTSAGYNATYNVYVTGVTTFTIDVSSSLPSPAVGTIISSVKDPSATTFTYTVSNTLATPATGAITAFSGEVIGLNLITSGTGYTSVPTVTISPSTGVFISFTSTGSLPSPLVSGVAYRAEAPLNTSTGNFTVKGADFGDVNITSSGTGTLFVSLSRSFSVTFNNNWEGDFTNLVTGQQLYFGTDYLLPNTSPSIDNGVTPFYLNKINNTTGKIYNSLVNANAGGVTGLITITSFGSGQSYYALRKSFRSLPFGNLITPSEIVFLSEDQIVRFSTTNTLPAPLVAGTDYTIKLFGNSIKVYLGGILQVLTTPGTGQLSLDILRTFNVPPSTSIDADQAHFNTGDAVVPRAKEGDVLPTGLTAGTTYYARRVDNNSFELYDTLAQARNTSSTTGRKTYTTTGETVESTFFVDSVTLPTFVKSVVQIDKPITEGYVSLYAYDYGRSNDMTLIGQYHPSEVNPQYRRIRIGKPCAWARISYRIQTPSITSIYDFIPLEQVRAIVTAVHACDLEDKDFAEQSARYWQIAFAYLKNQQESIDGHAMSVPQINAICYGDTSDPVMF